MPSVKNAAENQHIWNWDYILINKIYLIKEKIKIFCKRKEQMVVLQQSSH